METTPGGLRASSMAADRVCRVRAKPDQATFIWSDGSASFKLYLIGNGVEKFRDLVRQARERLSNLVKDYLHAADEDSIMPFCRRDRCQVPFRSSEAVHRAIREVRL
jgi:hypothetical protein